jgi:RNA polymerase sigma factor (sigma-70 family)
MTPEEREARIETKGRALVKSLANKYWSQVDAPHTTYAEAISIGMIAVRALEPSFDARRGVQFTTYLHSRVKGAILDALTGARVKSAIEAALKAEAQRYSANLSDQFDIWYATPEERRSLFGAEAARLAATLAATAEAQAFDVRGSEDDTIAHVDLLRVRGIVGAVLPTLKASLRIIWTEHYEAGKTCDAIAAEYDIDVSTVERQKKAFNEAVAEAMTKKGK